LNTYSKYKQKDISVWDVNEDAVSIALTVVNNLINNNNIDISSIGRLEVGTESSVDLAKSIKSYLMELFIGNKDIGGVDNINACYGGVSATLNSINWLKTDTSKKLAIVVITDLAIMDTTKISFQGAGSCALLLGPNPNITLNENIINCMKNTYDFQKPIKSNLLGPYCNGYESMVEYHKSFKYCIEQLKLKYNKSILDFDYIVIHGGLCKIFVINTFKKLCEWEKIKYEDIEGKFIHGTTHGERIGGLYTASLFFSLHSLLEHVPDNIDNKEVLLFGYGSGSCASLFTATVKRNPQNFNTLTKYLDNRDTINYKELISNHTNHLAMINDNQFNPTYIKNKNVYYLDNYKAVNNIRTYKLN